MTEKYDLSRRKILAGIGTIGAAGVGAGMGTSALFSDEESFTDNSFTAGTLDLTISVKTAWHGADEGLNVSEASDYEDADALSSITATDVKPGDWGVVQFCFNNDDNPAYLWGCGDLTSSSENGFTEPEPEDQNNEGELEEEAQAVLFYCERDDENNTTNPLLEDPQGVHPGDQGYDIVSRIDSGNISGIGPVITSGSMASVLGALDNGIPLDNDPNSGGRQPFPAGNGDQCICLLAYVPRAVGNNIQSDSMSFDVGFHSVQARHNDGSVNPCITSTNVEGFGKLAYEGATKPWFAKARNQNSGYELEVGNAPGTSATSEFNYGGSSFSGDLAVSYDASAGEATLDVDGTTVSYDVDDTPGDAISVVARGNESADFAAARNIRVNGSTPSGSDEVVADGSGVFSLNINDLDTSVDWELTADIELENLGGSNDENPAVYVDVLST